MVRSIRFALCALLCLSSFCKADTFQFNHENVLGTSLEIKLDCANRAEAKATESEILEELDRLNALLSTYDKGSQMSRWLSTQATSVPLAGPLMDLLASAETIHRKSDGAFDVRVGDSIQLWKNAVVNDQLPDENALRRAASATHSPAWQIESGNASAIRIGNHALTFDGIATGLMVDRMCARAMACAGVRGAMINLGGDLKAVGDFEEAVTIADPQSPVRSLCRLELKNAALTTSGNYERGFKVNGQWFSHIIDPRSGRPVDHIRSATAIAPTTLEADAWATAFCVMSVEQSLSACEQESQLSCMLVLKDGSIVSSPNFPKRVLLTAFRDDSKSDGPRDAGRWNDGAELQIEFEINRAGGGGRYRRPYVAVWVEDADQFPVRTLTLWMQTDEPGPRWHRDLKRWYKNDAVRRLVDDKKLIGTISAATKPPGVYKVAWDGKDDNGKLVAKGKYTLYIEAAREHGTYQLMSKEFNIGEEEVKLDLGQNDEIKMAKAHYTPKGESK